MIEQVDLADTSMVRGKLGTCFRRSCPDRVKTEDESVISIAWPRDQADEGVTVLGSRAMFRILHVKGVKSCSPGNDSFRMGTERENSFANYDKAV
jgi:hypothetical protein